MNAEKAENNKEKDSFFSNFEKKFQTHKELGKNKKEKKLLDEINLLLEEDDKIKKEIAEKRLENIHN
ncbi:MAG: hypothetical protein LBF15_02220 [Candidatus Peribacteria bacterium]|jgi:hypothetical protein|nr:hypothetical protein [Candidatus Peribacteria bacterium]